MKTAVMNGLVVLMLSAPATVERARRSVALGPKAAAGQEDGVAIGHRAGAKGFPGIARETAAETIAIGAGAKAEGWRCSAIRARARAGVVSATAVGRGALAWGPHMIAIGRGAFMEQVKRSPELNIGNGQSRWDVQTSSPRTFTIHGMDAYDARFDQDPKRFRRELYDKDDPETWKLREEKDVAGGSLHIAAGRGTGTAAGGAIEFQTAPGGAVSKNRKNKLKTAMRIDTNYTANNGTPMLLWDNRTKTLRRVMVGPPDSGGTGFRALVIAN